MWTDDDECEQNASDNRLMTKWLNVVISRKGSTKWCCIVMIVTATTVTSTTIITTTSTQHTNIDNDNNNNDGDDYFDEDEDSPRAYEMNLYGVSWLSARVR